jgi:hypothetical protein
VAGSSWQWLAVAGSGWQWLAVAGSGWQWLAVAGSGWQWRTLHYNYRQKKFCSTGPGATVIKLFRPQFTNFLP